MATQTTNLGLTLPIGTENVSRQIINDNMTAIDTAIGALQQGHTVVGDIETLEQGKVDKNDVATDAETAEMLDEVFGGGE